MPCLRGAVVDEDRHVAEGVVSYLADGQRALRAHLDELGFEPHRILRQPLDVHVEGHVAPEQQTFAQSQIIYLFRKMAPAHLYERSGAAAGIYLELPSELGFEGAPAVHERRQILLRGQHAARAREIRADASNAQELAVAQRKLARGLRRILEPVSLAQVAMSNMTTAFIFLRFSSHIRASSAVTPASETST